jgi:large subunit ribosomal protein L15
MKLNEIKPAEGSRKRSKRVGRGRSSGWGKTSARGHNGQKARSGGGVNPGFEGGQMPLQRRLPKRGFRNTRFAGTYTEVRLHELEKAFSDGEEVTEEALRDRGLMRTKDRFAKVLGTGDLSRKLTVKVAKVTKGARAAVESAGGTVEEQ